MPGIGAPELIVILVIALLVLGPKKLPEVGKSLGKGMREFKDGISNANPFDDDDEDERPVRRPKQVASSTPVAPETAATPVVPESAATPVAPETAATPVVAGGDDAPGEGREAQDAFGANKS
jgi:sec-independent protein translocase protein TatA